MSDSLSEIFSDHYQSVYRLALSLSGNHADAEDIAQEVFVAIIGALPKFRGDAKLSTWIYRIALRVGNRWLARRGGVAELPVTLAATDQSIPIDLINALRKLPTDLRIIVLLVSIEGLSHEEAAEVLAVPTGTVASRLHYARKRLVKLLDGM
ncbi:MAG: RNA polymerase sigma factor [Proteobacteria bacterium]|nr:RNA polymerase sigma factor [Pseudomonadota bacterium]